MTDKNQIRKWIKNCEEFLFYWDSIPNGNVSEDLANFREGDEDRNPPTCDSIACAMGWAVHMPPFRRKIVWDFLSIPRIRGGDEYGYPDVSVHLFGRWIGQSRVQSAYDEGEAISNAGITDHEIVKRRFQAHINKLKCQL